MANLPAPQSALQNIYRTRDAGSSLAQYVCLDRNERLSPLPDWFLQSLSSATNNGLLSHYPRTDSLYEKLALGLGLPEQSLLLTPGSDGAIKSLFHAYVSAGDKVVMLDPSYAMYPVYADIFGAIPRKIQFHRDLSFDTTALLDEVSQGPKLVVIANPNQPTGTLLDEQIILEVLERARAVHALVAIDEAYYPFSDSSSLPLLKRFDNLVIIRTFSKATGLAGLRIGFAAGHPEVIANLYKVRGAHDVNAVAAFCAELCLDHPDVALDYVNVVRAGTRTLAGFLQQAGLQIWPVHTNFMLARLPQLYAVETVVAGLRRRGYLVKGPFDADCLKGCIRITVGPPQLMEAFGKELTDTLNNIRGGKEI